MSSKLHSLIEEMTNGETVSRQAVRDAALARGMFPEHRFRKAFHQAMKRLETAGAIACDGDTVELVTAPEELQERAPATRQRELSQEDREDAVNTLMALLKQHNPGNAPFDPYRFGQNGDIGGMETGAVTAAVLDGMASGELRCANKPGEMGRFRIVINAVP